MQIPEAINALKNALGIACGAGTAAKDMPPLLGDDICSSVTEFKPSRPAADRSIHTFDPNAPKEVIDGGLMTINFFGHQQPEAVRTLDSILTPILNDLLKRDLPMYRSRLGKTEQRILEVRIPDEVAGAFVSRVNETATLINENKQLAGQFRAGNELSLEHINKIPGAKPYVQLLLSDFVVQGTEIVHKPPHFILKVDGVPNPLARGLAEIMGKELKDLPDSPATTNRSHTQRFSGDTGRVSRLPSMTRTSAPYPIRSKTM